MEIFSSFQIKYCTFSSPFKRQSLQILISVWGVLPPDSVFLTDLQILGKTQSTTLRYFRMVSEGLTAAFPSSDIKQPTDRAGPSTLEATFLKTTDVWPLPIRLWWRLPLLLLSMYWNFHVLYTLPITYPYTSVHMPPSSGHPCTLPLGNIEQILVSLTLTFESWSPNASLFLALPSAAFHKYFFDVQFVL